MQRPSWDTFWAHDVFKKMVLMPFETVSLVILGSSQTPSKPFLHVSLLPKREVRISREPLSNYERGPFWKTSTDAPNPFAEPLLKCFAPFCAGTSNNLPTPSTGWFISCFRKKVGGPFWVQIQTFHGLIPMHAEFDFRASGVHAVSVAHHRFWNGALFCFVEIGNKPPRFYEGISKGSMHAPRTTNS